MDTTTATTPEPQFVRVDEVEESVNAFRGLLIATLLSIPMWGLIALAVFGISKLFS